MIEKKCLNCGKIFRAFKSSKRRFCSWKCYTESSHFNPFKKGVKRHDTYNPRWKGGRSLGYILKKAKESLLKAGRQIERCELCGKIPKRISIHHKDRNRKNNNPNNLMVLCDGCHQREHPERKRNPNRCSKCGRLISLTKPHKCIEKKPEIIKCKICGLERKYFAKFMCSKCYHREYKRR